MHAAFDRLADHVLASARAGEVITLRLQAEQSDFVRFNRGLVRQPGSVDQRVATLRLVRDGRQATAERTLAGADALDFAALDDALAGLRERLPLLPEDPQLHLAEGANHTTYLALRDLPATEQMVADILDEAGAAGVDLVGFLAAGPVYAGYASSTGQRHWFATRSFNFEWCLYLHGNVATKSSYAGDHWDRAALARKIADGRVALDVLARPPKVLDPGAYRAWLTPAAFGELLSLANGWGGFSARAVRTAQSPLLGLWEGKQTLSPLFTLTEDAGAGVAPRFDDDGWTRPDRVPLVDAGLPGSLLVSSRSAREYALTANGAVGEEAALSPTVDAGTLASVDVLPTLDTGLWIGALWYTNWSNRFAGRATGMTRFATFWVEGGELVAPIAAMRFDDSLYRTFGTELEAVGAERELMLSSGTYYRRSTESLLAPGLLLRSFALSL
jgi:predicted Zn-dependent protease